MCISQGLSGFGVLDGWFDWGGGDKRVGCCCDGVWIIEKCVFRNLRMGGL